MTAATAPSSVDTGFLHKPRELAENTLYKAQHHALAVGFGVLMRGFHHLMEPTHRRASMSELLVIDGRFKRMLERDLQNARDGIYPRSVLFDLPLGAYLRVIPHAVVELPRILRRK